jgi:hypothetical protein
MTPVFLLHFMAVKVIYTNKITTKKRQVEKDALLRMFRLRTIEIRQNWITLG